MGENARFMLAILDYYDEAEIETPAIVYRQLTICFSNKTHLEIIFPKQQRFLTLLQSYETWERQCKRARLAFASTEEIETARANGLTRMKRGELPDWIEWNQEAEDSIIIEDFCAAELKNIGQEIDAILRPFLNKLATKQGAKRAFNKLLKTDLINATDKQGTLTSDEANQPYAPDRLVNLNRAFKKSNDQYRKYASTNLNKTIPSELNTQKRNYYEFKSLTHGMSDIAESLGLQWVMITLTPPKAFYTQKQIKGEQPEQKHRAAKYLQTKWEAVCRDLPKIGLAFSNDSIFGFRVLEPHKDKTPHWHMLIYYPYGKLTLLKEIFNRHFKMSKNRPHFSKKIKRGAAITQEKPVNIDTQTINQSLPTSSKAATRYMLKNMGPYEEPDIGDTSEAAISKEERISNWYSGINARKFQRFGLSHAIKNWRLFKEIAYSNQLVTQRHLDENLFIKLAIQQQELLSYTDNEATMTAAEGARIARYAVKADFVQYYRLIKDEKISHITGKTKSDLIGIKFLDGLITKFKHKI